MPAISSHGFTTLHAREWRDTVGQSGMTPTAFSFLIPVFVVAIAAPFLCVFCIRKRRQGVPPPRRPPPKTKKPALRRAEAREKLNDVTEVVDVNGGAASGSSHGDDGVKPEVETRSVLERECAICLSTLRAPAPPEPAKLSPETPITDEAALPASLPPTSTDTDNTTTNPEADTILRLQVCNHEFHAECLVSWFVLRKPSCPICRSVYMSKEAMQQLDEEEQLALGGPPPDVEAQTPAQPQTPAARNWRYFLHGNHAARPQQPQIEMSVRTPEGAVAQTGGETAQQEQQSAPVQEQQTRSRWVPAWVR